MDYRYFNIDSNTSLDDLKSQYRRLSKKHHPDAGGSAEVFKEVNLEYRKALLEIRNKAFRKDDIDLYKLINNHIYDINKHIKKSNLPDEMKPAISYLTGLGINRLGNFIKQKLK